MDFYTVSQTIMGYINTNDYITLIPLIIIFISLWLYNQIRNSLSKKKTSDLEFVDLSLEHHLNALATLYNFTKNSLPKSDLICTLYSLSKYSDELIVRETIELVNSVSNEDETKIASKMTKHIHQKIEVLKKMQLYNAVQKDYKFSVDAFLDFIRKSDFDLLIKPVYYVCIILLILGTFFLISIYPSVTTETIDPIIYRNYLYFLIIFIIWFLTFSFTVDLLFSGEFKFWKLFLLGYHFLSSFLTFFLLNLLDKPWLKLFVLLLFFISIIIVFIITIKSFRDNT